MNTLSLCLIVKDEEEDYLREWVDYHHRLGVEAFYIYDNESQIRVRKTLDDYVGRGWVSVQETHGQFMQDTVYTHCLHFCGAATQWLGFLDADEFIVPHSADDLREFLIPYGDYGGLAINWVLFGSSGHIQKPPGCQIESFVDYAPVARGAPGLVKCIVQPERAINMLTPHTCAFYEGNFCVGEDFKRQEEAFRPFSAEKIQVNHYLLRSREQYVKKIERGRADHGQSPYHRREYFDEIDRLCTAQDRRAHDLYKRREKSPITSPPASFPDFVPPPDHFSPPQIDFLRYATALNRAEKQRDEGSIEKIFRIALQKYPDISQTQVLLADWLGGHGRLEEAGSLLEKSHQADPSAVAVRKKLGLNQAERRNFSQAEANLRFALEADAQDHEVLAALGGLYIETRRFKDALFCFDAILSSQPWHLAAWEGILTVMKEGRP